MSIWENYASRITARGGSPRGSAEVRETRFLNTKLPKSLSYKQVLLDGQPRNIAILDTDNLDTKNIYSMPGEDIRHGGLIVWKGFQWLITEKDANTDVYTRAIMQQCNYLLRWVSDEQKIIERWCVVEDGTKYLTGIDSDNDIIVSRGDTRISVTIAKDSETLKLNRKARFIIDDYHSAEPLAYRLTKPYKMGGSYDENGVVIFVMQECNAEDSDNLELHIANYYDYFPRESDNLSEALQESASISSDTNGDTPNGKKVWL